MQAADVHANAGIAGVHASAREEGIEEGLSKKLKLDPAVEVCCDEGPWEAELKKLADHVASTG